VLNKVRFLECDSLCTFPVGSDAGNILFTLLSQVLLTSIICVKFFFSERSNQHEITSQFLLGCEAV